MKLVVAIVHPERLEVVRDALNREEAWLVSATRVADDHETVTIYRGGQLRAPRLRLRLEILVLNDLAVPDAIEAVKQAAGDQGALLLVTPVDDVVHVRPRANGNGEVAARVPSRSWTSETPSRPR